jgi:hypothetical protein
MQPRCTERLLPCACSVLHAHLFLQLLFLLLCCQQLLVQHGELLLQPSLRCLSILQRFCCSCRCALG